MRKRLPIVFALAALSGCLAARPAGTGQDAGVGGSTTSTGGGGAGGNGGHGSGGLSGSGGAGTGGHAGTTGGGGLIASGGTGGGGTGGAGGTVLLPAALSGTTSHDFAGVSLGTASASFNWMVSNAAGAAATGALSLSNDDPSEVSTINGCTGTLAGGASCTVAVTFRPNVMGALTAHLSVSSSLGGTATLTLTATGLVQVTVSIVGTGTVTSVEQPGINCPGTCSASFSTPQVTLTALTANGSDSLFSGWSNPACPGIVRKCPTNLTTATVPITATFTAVTANLIFATLGLFPTNYGGAAAYDSVCNGAATAAGLNNATNTAFIALMSDSNQNAITRLGTARGWVRLDGKPFADTQTALFTNNQVFYPITFQEDGQLRNSAALFTGTQSTGTASPNNCNNWSSTVNDGSSITCGSSFGGPVQWSSGSSNFCGAMSSLICMGKTKNVPVSVPAPGAGRKIWVSSALFTPNATSTPDALCQASRPAGVSMAAALIATTTKAASSVLGSTTSYYRLDGTFVGTGTDLLALPAQLVAKPMSTGIWQSEDGLYPLSGAQVWVGSLSLTAAGILTCGDWADPTQASGYYGISQVSGSPWWGFFAGVMPCNSPGRIYCVQTAP
jgi:hypothetical protein